MKMRIGGRSQSAAAGAAILLFSVACTDALGPRHGDVAPPHSVTGSGLSLSLVGANIVRHKPIPGEVQTKRFVLQGERTARGSCKFIRKIEFKDGDRIPSEWVIESDPSTCTDILAQGHIPPGRRPNQNTALGKSPAVAPNLFQDGANYSMGDQNAAAIAGSHITTEWRWQGWFTAMADIDDAQFSYNVGPNCLTGGSGYVGWYWASNDTFTTFQKAPDAFWWGGQPDGSCETEYLEHNQAWTVGYSTNDCFGYGTFTPHLGTRMTMNFQNGILYRIYNYWYDNDFWMCNTAMMDFQFFLDAENPPGGMVNSAAPLPTGAIP